MRHLNTESARITNTSTVTVPEKPEPCPDGKCCWHTAHWQHTIPNHRDEVCCHCGTARCVNTLADKRREGHGPYMP